MNTNKNATKANPTAATAAAAILAAANAAANAATANAATANANASTPTAPVTPTAVPTTPMANTATPTVAPIPKTKYELLTDEKTNILYMLNTICDNNIEDNELVIKLMEKLESGFNKDLKDLSVEEVECDMADAAEAFSSKQDLKQFRSEENYNKCKKLHKCYTTHIKKSIERPMELTVADRAEIVRSQIEFIKLLKNRGGYIGDIAHYIVNSNHEAGGEITQKDSFKFCSIVYAALDIIEDVNKAVSIVGMINRFKFINIPIENMKYIIKSIVTSYEATEEEFINSVLPRPGIMDQISKSKLIEMLMRPGTIMLFDELGRDSMDPLYRIENPESEPNLVSLVQPGHYYFSINENNNNTIFDIDIKNETIKRVMVNEAA